MKDTNTTKMEPKIIRQLTRIYQRLVKLYPPSFQQTYAQPMAQVFEDCCRRNYAQGGALGLASYLGRTSLDLGISVLREHLQKYNQMNRNTFIKLSSWVLGLVGMMQFIHYGMLFYLTQIRTALLNPGEFMAITSRWIFSQTITANAILPFIGLLGIRLFYKHKLGKLGEFSLLLSLLGAVGIVVVQIGMMSFNNPAIYPILGVPSLYAFFGGLILLGISTVKNRPFMKLNAVPLLIGLPWVLSATYYLLTNTTQSNPGSGITLLLSGIVPAVGWLLLGYLFQSESRSTERMAAA